MDKCSYDRFEGMYNKGNGSVWFFGKCYVSIMEVIKIIDDVPTEYDDFIEICGLVCFVNSSTGQIWYSHVTYDDAKHALRELHRILTHGSGKTSLNRKSSYKSLEFLNLSECD